MNKEPAQGKKRDIKADSKEQEEDTKPSDDVLPDSSSPNDNNEAPIDTKIEPAESNGKSLPFTPLIGLFDHRSSLSYKHYIKNLL